MALRYDDVSEIIKLIDASSCDEFVLETDEIRLVLRRRGSNGAAAEVSPAPAGPTQAPRPMASATPAPEPPRAIARPAGSNVVTAPMVGTFYRSPSPDTPPFVEIGAKVAKGDPICIIEVMKLFTTIHAEWSGTVKEVGAENATLVEYGQMLFVIVPE
jgi:acetyl-CoA carboxylase biotin carboxyl carrier protein